MFVSNRYFLFVLELLKLLGGFFVGVFVDNCPLFSLADLRHRNKAALSDWLVLRRGQ